MGGHMVAVSRCYVHGELFEFDPDTVVTVLIDPQTNRPPDVDERGQQREPTPAAVARAVQQVICPDCVASINAERAGRGLPLIKEGM